MAEQAMNPAVREALASLMAEHGRSLCTTPRMIGILLRQQFPDADADIQALEQAFVTGCVAPMLRGLPEHADVDSLSEKLAETTKMPADQARWAVETWSYALQHERPGDPMLSGDWARWNQLSVGPMTGSPSLYHRSIVHLAVVGVGGAIGGALLGVIGIIRPELQREPFWRDAVMEVPAWAQSLSVIALGILGGGAGGLLGWILGGGQSWTYSVLGTTTLGRLLFSAIGAAMGALLGGVGGLMLIGLIGVMAGSLVGALLGAGVGLMSAQRRSRNWLE